MGLSQVSRLATAEITNKANGIFSLSLVGSLRLVLKWNKKQEGKEICDCVTYKSNNIFSSILARSLHYLRHFSRLARGEQQLEITT